MGKRFFAGVHSVRYSIGTGSALRVVKLDYAEVKNERSYRPAFIAPYSFMAGTGTTSLSI
jgi:hypothetical protein